jgi:hypothetical protein
MDQSAVSAVAGTQSIGEKAVQTRIASVIIWLWSRP